MPIKFVQAGAGVALTTVPGDVSILGCIEGNFLVLHALQDGVTGTAIANSGINIRGLADESTPTAIHTSAVGGAGEAFHIFWFARARDNGDCTVNMGVTSGGDDVFCRLYEFSGVRGGGSTVDDVALDHGALGNATSASVGDAGSTAPITPGLVTVNLIAVSVNTTIPEFTGETGGDWIKPVSEFSSAAGGGAALGIQIADMGIAGIFNGTCTITSGPWGCVGFKLMPAEYDTSPTGYARRGMGVAS